MQRKDSRDREILDTAVERTKVNVEHLGRKLNMKYTDKN